MTIIGSHAAKTCQIVVMKHTESGVASLGHFDNFSCWQFGESSPHKEGLQTMIDEIEFLSKEDLKKGHIQVSVFGGYVDKYVLGDYNQMKRFKISNLQNGPRYTELQSSANSPAGK